MSALRAVLRPLAQDIRSDAGAIEAALSLFAHQLVEHLSWQHALETKRAELRTPTLLHLSLLLRVQNSLTLLELYHSARALATKNE